MPQSIIDPSITRVDVNGFACPLGTYPTDPTTFVPLQGYYLEFESAEGDTDEEWEEWPDRYLFDVVITHGRLPALLRAVSALLPGRFFPILDVIGHDAYREIDPYIAYDPVANERFVDGVRRHRAWLMEDGLVGFGAMSIEPFVYIYVDEHKIMTIRVETRLKERIERILAAFDLRQMEEPLGVDSVEHEHREALADPDANPDAMTREQIVEELRHAWSLTLNIDPDTNVDDDGNELGVTGWRCIVRRFATDQEPQDFEALVAADSLALAERYATEAVSPPDDPERPHPDNPEPAAADDRDPDEPADRERTIETDVLAADRVTPDEFADLLGQPRSVRLLEKVGVHAVRKLPA